MSGGHLHTVLHRLRDGYGVEDMRVMDGVPLKTSRAIISNLRRLGVLREALGLDPASKLISDLRQ